MYRALLEAMEELKTSDGVIVYLSPEGKKFSLRYVGMSQDGFPLRTTVSAKVAKKIREVVPTVTRAKLPEAIKMAMRDDQARDQKKRYTYDGNWDRACTCGCSLNQHAAVAPHDCFDCDCEKFRPAKAKKAESFSDAIEAVLAEDDWDALRRRDRADKKVTRAAEKATKHAVTKSGDLEAAAKAHHDAADHYEKHGHNQAVAGYHRQAAHQLRNPKHLPNGMKMVFGRVVAVKSH